MDKYYHFTQYEYLTDINKFGLVTQIGDRSLSISDDRQAVFLSKGTLSAVLMYFDMKWFYERHKDETQGLLTSTMEAIERLNKQLEKEQNKNNRIKLLRRNIEKLKADREAAIKLKKQVENMKKYLSFDEYWGKGVYLSISNVQDVKYNPPDLHDCWVEKDIEPENINVVILKHKETGEIIDDKSSIIDYFMAMTTAIDLFYEYRRTIGINDDKYTAHEIMKEFDKYYLEHKERFNNLKKNYDLIELPIKEYMNTYRQGIKKQ